MSTDVKKLKGAALAKELERIPFLRAWATQVEAHALAELVAGRKIPGYKLVKTQPGHRKWTDSGKVLARLRKWNVPLDEVAPRVVLTPAQMEKTIEPEEFEALGKFITRPQGKVTIAASSDPRKPVPVEDWSDD